MKGQLAEKTHQHEMDRLSQEVRISQEKKRQRRKNLMIFGVSIVITTFILVLLLQ